MGQWVSGALRAGAITLGGALVLAALLEGVFRLAGFAPAGVRAYSIEFSRPDPVVGFRAQENANWIFAVTPHGGAAIGKRGSTDSAGLRPSKVNADCIECPVIVALGDSITFGAESADDETWPEQLALALREKGLRYRVVNLSFRGWSTLQQAAALQTLREPGRITHVVHVPVPNDSVENIRDVYKLPVPLGRRGSNGGFEVVQPVIAEAHRRMAFDWELDNLLRKSALLTQLLRWHGKPLPQLDARMPAVATDAQAYRVFWSGGLLDSVYRFMGLLVEGGEEGALAREAMGQGFGRMKQAADAAGARLIVAPIAWGPFTAGETGAEFAVLMGLDTPAQEQHLRRWQQYNRALSAIAQSRGATVLDTSQNVFADMRYRDYVATPGDWHYSAAANRVFARRVAEQLLPLLE